jgi:hypothetical protein
MRIIRPITLLVLGIVIGVAATGYWSPVTAQISGRFSVAETGKVGSSTVLLVRDAKSPGCWLLTQGGGGSVALAPAPPDACK